MSKVNVGVGDEFPINDAGQDEAQFSACERRMSVCAYRSRWRAGTHGAMNERHWDERHWDERQGDDSHAARAVGLGLGSLAFLSLAALAVMNPLTTLAVTGAGAAAYGAGRMGRRRRAFLRRRARAFAQGAPDASYTDAPAADKKEP
jgi:Flp pilus assembly protein TadB